MAVVLQTNTLDLDWDAFDEEDEANSCMTCYGTLTDNRVDLKCGHSFCYECLVESYRGIKCNFSGSSSHRLCPYCRSPADYLHLKEGMVPLKGIHREFSKKKKMKPIQFKQCSGIVKSGPNKGKQCTCAAKVTGFCGRHAPKSAT